MLGAAIQKQQTQIAAQAEKIQRQRHEIESLEDTLKLLEGLERRLAKREATVCQSPTIQFASKESEE